MGFKYEIEITATVAREDGGYWSKTPLDEFLEKCDDTRGMQVYLKQGAGELKRLPAKIRIARVIVDVDPETGKS